MGEIQKDREILRDLAEKYSAIANLDVQKERIDRYYKTISMEEVRPVLLIDEVPWGEINDEALRIQCENEDHHWLEQRLRRALYQWEHFQVDTVFPPKFQISKVFEISSIGLEVQEKVIQGDTGTEIKAHEYFDQLKTEEDLQRLSAPTITYGQAETEKAAALAEEVFKGLMPVEVVGSYWGYSVWDNISMFRGVDNLLLDLAARPEFMHRTVQKFVEIAESMRQQYQELDLLDNKLPILHCTPACSTELPAEDFDGKARLKDVWGRCAAQIFAAVSPEMHDEFDLQYNQQLFGDCGLLYYGCCEPLDLKIDILRKRFSNLRKISITPWADPEAAVNEMGSDFVLAGKPNPAFVNSPKFNPKPVEQELRRYLDVCKRNGTTCEFVLKDISTIANTPENLTRWAETAEGVINQYY